MYSIATYTGNGSSTQFTIPCPYLAQAHLKVTVAGVLKTLNTDYTINTGTNKVVFGVAPANAATIEIKRVTPRDGSLVNFTSGAGLPESDLDTASLVSLYIDQEALDALEETNTRAFGVTERVSSLETQTAEIAERTSSLEETVEDLESRVISAEAVESAKNASAGFRDAAEGFKNQAESAAEASADSAALAASYQAKIVVATVAALGGLSVTPLTVGDVAIVRDYAVASDGGFGIFELRSTSATPIAGVIVSSPTLGKQWYRKHAQGLVHAEWFGAVGDGVTDDKPAIQSAIDYLAALGGGVVKLGAKTYVVNTSVEMKANITLSGSGKFQTVLKVGAGGQVLLYGFTAASLTVQDLTLWGYGDRASGQESEIHLCYLGCTVGDLSFLNVRALHSRYFSLKGFASAGTARVVGCEVKYSLRDGIHLSNSLRALVHDCDVDRVGDDAIAVHTYFEYEGINDHFVQITNNRVSMSLGIKVLGCQRGLIQGNILDRCVSYGILLGIDGEEGETSHRDVIIANNVIKNTMRGVQWGYGDVCAGIYLMPPLSRAGDASLNPGGLLPGEFDDTTNVWQPPETAAHRYIGDLAPIARLSRFIVSANTIVQELPDSDYADLGFGDGWNAAGVANPAGVTFLFNAYAIRIDGGLENCEFSNNILSGFYIGVNFNSTTSVEPRYRHTRFYGNRFTRMYRGYDVSSGSGITTLIGVVSESDVFDLDPYNTNAYREANGSWLSTDPAVNICVLSNSTVGFVLTSPKIRNVRSAVFASSGSVHVERPLYYAKPINAASGHKGCSELLGIENGGTLVEEDCDPTSATYGALVAVRNYSGLSASTIPTTGWYFSGAYVRKSNPAVDGNNMILRGWIRATTGTNHVAGTDWLLDYGSNVSPAT